MNRDELFAIEIVSPGHLPDNLTVEKIRAGNSNIRNPILVSHVAKGLLPYRDLASGIQRVLEAWPEIRFTDDRDGCLFTATVHRIAKAGSGERAGKTNTERASRLESWLQAWLESAAMRLDPGAAWLVTAPVTVPVTAQVTVQVIAQVIVFCETPRSSREIMAELGLRHWKTFQSNYLTPFLESGLLERTIPDKPNSRLQKYRLTEMGRGLLAGAAGGESE